MTVRVSLMPGVGFFFLSRTSDILGRRYGYRYKFPIHARSRDIATTPACCYGVLHYSVSMYRSSWGATVLPGREVALADTSPELPFVPNSTDTLSHRYGYIASYRLKAKLPEHLKRSCPHPSRCGSSLKISRATGYLSALTISVVSRRGAP